MRPCNAAQNEVVGSYCQTAGGNPKNGFCYESSTGTLECGRMLSFAERHSSVFTAAPTTARCPAGTPLTTPGVITVKRLLIAGCMKAGDANFKSTAEVHLPEDCASPSDISPGCMFPGARNYAPGSKQSAKCLYELAGCTDPTALNYNSEASVDDGSCKADIRGCTLKNAAYEGVDSDTPMYKKLYVGKPDTPGAGSGRNMWPTYGQVTNYNPAATVNVGCNIVVEGCMDTTAVNYDPKATVQSSTWCVAPKTGCMMPDPAAISVATGTQGTRVHSKDGGAGNFDATATVNSRSTCTVGRYGCNDPTMFNYDSHATINDGSCVPDEYACLDATALNYGCGTNTGFTNCYPVQGATHDAGICNSNIPPPAAASPSVPPGADTETGVLITFIAAGTVEDYPQSKIDQIIAQVSACLLYTSDAPTICSV